jgi:hypothetical protein
MELKRYTTKKYLGWKPLLDLGSLPFTFADLQMKIEQMLKAGGTPEQVFDVLSGNDMIRSLNYTIYAAARKLGKLPVGVSE